MKIWQAARATSAATTFFDSITFADDTYVDGSLGKNNPISTVMSEAEDPWKDRSIGCVVSIGTGVAPVLALGGNVFTINSTLQRMALETEITAEEFQRSHQDLDNRGAYYRFNVDQGLEHIGLEEANKQSEIIAMTARYIQKQENFLKMGKCAEVLGTELGSLIFA